MVYARPKVKGKPLTFTVSGLLYNSNVIFFDHQTNSLWHQLTGRCFSGKRKGEKMNKLPMVQTTWRRWKQEHPDTLVLSPQTGFEFDYERDPYSMVHMRDEQGNLIQGSYWKHKNALMFLPVNRKKLAPRRFDWKEKMLAVEVDGVYKAYPFSALKKAPKPLEDEVNGKRLTIHFLGEKEGGYITDEEGKLYPSHMVFWFGWYAFHPDTQVYEP